MQFRLWSTCRARSIDEQGHIMSLQHLQPTCLKLNYMLRDCSTSVDANKPASGRRYGDPFPVPGKVLKSCARRTLQQKQY